MTIYHLPNFAVMPAPALSFVCVCVLYFSKFVLKHFALVTLLEPYIAMCTPLLLLAL